jgi:hypothetical protein
MNTTDSTSELIPNQIPPACFDKKGVVEVGVTPSEVSSKPSTKIEEGQALAGAETAGEDIVKKAAALME